MTAPSPYRPCVYPEVVEAQHGVCWRCFAPLGSEWAFVSSRTAGFSGPDRIIAVHPRGCEPGVRL